MFSVSPLVSWFEEVKRDLPWRNNPSPYEVLISEVMLQQTRVAVVVPYYKRWMGQFPTIQALANANEIDVIKQWEGLGYYARARNLHKAAKQIVEKYNGILPSEKKLLLGIQGIGPYTAGAILSFAFHQKEVAIDGNVARVLARLFQVEENIYSSAGKKKLDHLMRDLLPDQRPWVAMEAMIELGATFCTPQPKCSSCPFKQYCLAYQKEKTDQYPKKRRRPKTKELFRKVWIVESEGSLLVYRGRQGELMEGLYFFPFSEDAPLFEENDLRPISPLPKVSHSFTRYRAHLDPFLFQSPLPFYTPRARWIPCQDLFELPFCSGHRQILRTYLLGYQV